MSTYGQFCPVAKAMEVLDERWTLLVVRELLAGSKHFNEVRRGVPKMSPTLLSKRLRSLERHGIVERTSNGSRATYALTPCGRDLVGVVTAMGLWGLRWIGEMGEDDLDPHLLMWDMQRTIPIHAWPRGRTVVRFDLDDVAPKSARWWLMVNGDVSDVCDFDPGHDIDAIVSTGLRTLTRIWRGDESWELALRAGSVTVGGTSDVRRAVPGWLGQSTLAQLAAVPA